MEKTNKYNNAVYWSLFGASAILLVLENFTLSWLWFFVFTSFIFVTILNDILLKEQHWWNLVLTILQCALILLLAFITVGYGSIPLAFVAQVGFCVRYRQKASILMTVVLYTLNICVLYLFPHQNISSPYPAIFMMLSGLIAMLLLLSIKVSIKLKHENLESIIELQLNKRELRDLNRQMKHYSEEMEKITILRERNRISKQIHDTLGHVLTAVSVQLGAAELLLEKNPKEAFIKISNAKAQTSEGLNSIKQTLSLIDEDSILFEDRIFDIINKAEVSMNIKILPQIAAKGNLSIAVQEFILSALKEGITNGVRHGQASAFVFRFDMEEGEILFYLEDNGKGCDKINMGYGLTAMEKQALEYGGITEAYSIKDEGFVLKIAIPCKGDSK